ncbi:MAG: (d)CMP kinase [Planctomycetia bacterium]|nr:(d)CMP kinase [Planctomycetia bacterium]
MIITIDGPAGSGKSTVAEKVSERLGFEYLKTGIMYRSVALAGSRAGVDWARPEELEEVARKMELKFDGARIFINGEDVSSQVESLPVTAITKYAAENAGVREILTRKQREITKNKNYVTEGRDQGTVVFPEAEVKFFLDASAEERARRRYQQKCRQGESANYDEILRGILKRDKEDSERELAPLRAAPDAISIFSDGMTAEEVAEQIIHTVIKKYPDLVLR